MNDLLSRFSLAEYRSLTSIGVNGLYVLPNDVQAHLGKYCDSLKFFNVSSPYEINTSGSCTLLQYRNRYFAFATQHQLRNQDVNSACLDAKNEKMYITSSSYRNWIAPSTEEWSDRFDLCALEFTSSVCAGNIESSRFFPIGDGNTMSNGDEPLLFLAYGCAYSEQEYVLDESEDAERPLLEIKQRKRVWICDLHAQGSDDSLFKLKFEPQGAYNSDGFSGGAVFSIVHKDISDFRIKFAGIVCRGGTGPFLNAIKVDSVQRMIEAITTS